MTKLALKWLALAVIDTLFTLFARLVSPLVALFVRKDGTLPGWLEWFFVALVAWIIAAVLK